MITTKQRAFLKSKSHELKDIVFIGKEGLTENVLKQIETNLFAHELIKVKVQQGSDDSSYDLAQNIASRTGCQVVGVVGSKIILYKKTTKKDFKHYL